MLVFLAMSALTVWEGFVLKVLWAWFLLPLGLPAIGMAHAVGISALVGLLAHQAPPDLNDDDRLHKVFQWAVCGPIAALALGWIAKQFM